MLFKHIYYVLFIILLPCRFLAWGYTGHQLVAELAMYKLTDATRVKVERILNGMTAARPETGWMKYAMIRLISI